jgi:hypothetical protein
MELGQVKGEKVSESNIIPGDAPYGNANAKGNSEEQLLKHEWISEYGVEPRWLC